MAPKKKQTFVDKAEKDDGTRWIVVRDGQQVYPGEGTMKGHATRLATGLVESAAIRQVA